MNDSGDSIDFKSLHKSECDRILVTGGSGLVGNALKQIVSIHSDKSFYFASSSDADLRDLSQTELLFQRINPTHVIHLAARVGGLFANLNDNLGFFVDNMSINQNVLSCCFKFQIKKCVSMLSTCIFPDQTSYPIDESMIHNGPPHNSNYGYAYSKRMIEVLSRLYNEKLGEVRFVCVIPTNIFGPHDNFHPQNSHVVASLIRKAHLVKQNKVDSLIVCGTGKPLRQFIFSIDLAKLLYWITFNYSDNIPLILCSDEEISILQVAKTVCDCFELPHDKITLDSTFSDGQHKKTANNARLKQIAPFFQFTSFSDAMKQTCLWYNKSC